MKSSPDGPVALRGDMNEGLLSGVLTSVDYLQGVQYFRQSIHLTDHVSTEQYIQERIPWCY